MFTPILSSSTQDQYHFWQECIDNDVKQPKVVGETHELLNRIQHIREEKLENQWKNDEMERLVIFLILLYRSHLLVIFTLIAFILSSIMERFVICLISVSSFNRPTLPFLFFLSFLSHLFSSPSNLDRIKNFERRWPN